MGNKKTTEYELAMNCGRGGLTSPYIWDTTPITLSWDTTPITLSTEWWLPKMPKRYIVNKDAAILFWDDDTKTVVKRAKDDELDVEKAFLWAYFQKCSGLSRTKANKYLKELKRDYEILEQDDKN